MVNVQLAFGVTSATPKREAEDRLQGGKADPILARVGCRFGSCAYSLQQEAIMRPRMLAGSLAEAVELASSLKSRGAFDWFRGQPYDWRPLRTRPEGDKVLKVGVWQCSGCSAFRIGRRTCRN